MCAECAVFSFINKYVHINKHMYMFIYIYVFTGSSTVQLGYHRDFLVLNHTNMIQTIFLEYFNSGNRLN